MCPHVVSCCKHHQPGLLVNTPKVCVSGVLLSREYINGSKITNDFGGVMTQIERKHLFDNRSRSNYIGSIN